MFRAALCIACTACNACVVRDRTSCSLARSRATVAVLPLPEVFAGVVRAENPPRRMSPASAVQSVAGIGGQQSVPQRPQLSRRVFQILIDSPELENVRVGQLSFVLWRLMC